MALKLMIEEALDWLAIMIGDAADDTGEEAKPCPQVFRLLVRVEGAVLELRL